MAWSDGLVPLALQYLPEGDMGLIEEIWGMQRPIVFWNIHEGDLPQFRPLLYFCDQNRSGYLQVNRKGGVLKKPDLFVYSRWPSSKNYRYRNPFYSGDVLYFDRRTKITCVGVKPCKTSAEEKWPNAHVLNIQVESYTVRQTFSFCVLYLHMTPQLILERFIEPQHWQWEYLRDAKWRRTDWELKDWFQRAVLPQKMVLFNTNSRELRRSYPLEHTAPFFGQSLFSVVEEG